MPLLPLLPHRSTGGTGVAEGPHVTSLLIFYPDVPPSSLIVTPSAAYDVDHPIDSTFFGERHAFGWQETASTSISIVYDLGSLATRTVDHFVLGDVSTLKYLGCTKALLEGSNNGSSWTNVLGTTANFQTRTFDGPDGRDVIFTATRNTTVTPDTTTAYRYFRVSFAAPTSILFITSKIYFGAALDVGADPDFYEMSVVTARDSDTWRYPRGQVVMSRAFPPLHRFSIQYDGLTDDQVETLSTKLLSDPYRNTVFLYASTYEDPLYDNKLVHCRVVAEECSLTKRNDAEDYWDVVLLFEELS